MTFIKAQDGLEPACHIANPRQRGMNDSSTCLSPWCLDVIILMNSGVGYADSSVGFDID
jgi:hypothetical protein